MVVGALIFGMLLKGSGEEVRAQTTTQRLLIHTKKFVSVSGSVSFYGGSLYKYGKGTASAVVSAKLYAGYG